MNLESDKYTAETADYNRERKTSLQTRITLAITITTVLAAFTVGLFAYNRNLDTQSFLGGQFQTSTKEKAESQIQSLVLLEAKSINQVFVDVDQTVISTAAIASNLLDQSATFEDGKYWDVQQKLTKLPNGAWDNPNDDQAAVFAPSNVEITEEIGNELNAIIQLDLSAPEKLEFNPDIVALYFISSNEITVYYPNIDLANVVPSDFKATEQPFYTNADSINVRDTAWTLPYQDPALTGLIVTSSTPVYDQNRKLRGVIGADLQLAKVNDRVKDLTIGETGYAFLIDSAGRIIAMPENGYEDLQMTPEEIPENDVPKQTLMEQAPPELRLAFQGMAQGGSGLSHITFHGEDHYLAYTSISSPKYSLGMIVPVNEMNAAVIKAQELVARENQQTQSFGILLLVIVVIVALLISFGLSRLLTNPLSQLTATAQKVSEGDLTVVAPETNVNEVNILAETFNAMTTQLKGMLENLEERVAARTIELDEANQHNQRRAEQFEAVAQVARDISSSQDLETLLPKITNVISERFGFYHVGVFLVDSNREYAILRAANSVGGRKMLERKHQLKIGETGIVGYVTNQNKARIALDIGKDAVYFDNPDLPDTHSELALPLRSGNQVIGALDVQSTEPDAFSQEDIETLSTLADQVSVAIQNARLYEETRNALTQSQALQQEFIRTGWRQFTRAQRLAGIHHGGGSTTLLKSAQSAHEISSDNVLELPITLRNQKIGTIKLRSKEEHHWDQDEIDIANAILERAAIAMENARLLNEAQRRAARERVIGDISASISTSSDMEGILRTAVQVLGRRMGGAEVVLELGEDSNNKEETNQ